MLGGVHATVCYDEILSRYPSLDYVLRGEAEGSMLKLAQGAAEENISGLSYRQNGQIKHNSISSRILDLDNLPFPARHFIDLNDYIDPLWNLYETLVVPIITSRGCPFLCTFCASKTTFGTKVHLS